MAIAGDKVPCNAALVGSAAFTVSPVAPAAKEKRQR